MGRSFRCLHVRFVSCRVSAHMEPPVSMEERYKAAMVLAGVGDAMGYRNGSWEFNMSGAL